jgi:hypothetical protein
MNTPDPASPREFTEFWAQRYADPNERLYTANINYPHHTVETLSELFKWKIGVRFFETMLKRTVKRNFLEKIDKARAFPPDAERFLNTFNDGGAIFRIFWLHCWHPRRFPIYDQHVHRAMIFIQHGWVEELDRYSDQKKIELYLHCYIPFFEAFGHVEIPFDLELDGVPGRKVDRALMAFGKSIQIPTSNSVAPHKKPLS